MDNIEEAAIIYAGNQDDSFREKIAFIDGAKSDAARDFHQKGLYSEEEVRELVQAFKVTMEFAKQFGLPCDIIELFEENKKKYV